MSPCPKCRSPLRSIDLDGLPASTCDQCHGLWLAREFVELWAERRGRTSGAVARPFDLGGNPATTTAWPCPDCATLMARVETDGLQVERCEQCQGVFFDSGELEAIGRTRHATGVADPMIASSDTVLESIGGGILAVLEVFFD